MYMWLYVDVSKNGGTQQPWVLPLKTDHFGVFWGYPYFWKHPCTIDISFGQFNSNFTIPKNPSFWCGSLQPSGCLWIQWSTREASIYSVCYLKIRSTLDRQKFLHPVWCFELNSSMYCSVGKKDISTSLRWKGWDYVLDIFDQDQVQGWTQNRLGQKNRVKLCLFFFVQKGGPMLYFTVRMEGLLSP